MLEYITSKELSNDIRRYNFALLFNRAKAQQIRTLAAQKLHDFASLSLQIRPQDCETMYTYIKTFGYIRHRQVTSDSMSAFTRLNEIATSDSKRFFRVWRGNLLNWSSIVSRRLAKAAGRYDTIGYQAPQPPKPLAKAQDKPALTMTTPAAELIVQRNLSKQGQNIFKKSMRRVQKQLPQTSTDKPQNNNRQPIPEVAPVRKSKPNFFKHCQKQITKTAIGGVVLLGGIFGIAALQNTSNPENKEKTRPDKIEKITTAPANNLEITEVKLPHPDSVRKNYYDSALKIHLGVSAREELYANLRNLAISQKINIPDGESIEHLAHVITISNLVQPNSSCNRFLQNCLHSPDTISAAAQNKLWHIVKSAGDRSQNIRGTSAVSNFDKQPHQIQQEHLNTLRKLKQTSR